jgi:SAM-dependent methyltransferase
LLETQGCFVDVLNHYSYGGKEDFQFDFRALVAGSGTGDAAIFLVEQLRDTDAEIIALDMSEAALAVARQRCEVRELSNVRFVCAALQDAATLELGEFGYINCSGVLQHLHNPDEGLPRLADFLKDNGAMYLMVYSTYGRASIYTMQAVLKQVADAQLPSDERIRRARALLEQASDNLAFKRHIDRFSSDIARYGDAGLFDLLLHSQDRAYTVPQIHQWLEQARLNFASFDAFGINRKLIYEPASYVHDATLSELTESKSVAQQHAICELIHGSMSKHSFYATKNTNAPPSLGAPGVITYFSSAYVTDDFLPTLHTYITDNPGKTVSMTMRDPHTKLSYTPTPHAAQLLLYLDGARDLQEIVARANQNLTQGALQLREQTLVEGFHTL